MLEYKIERLIEEAAYVGSVILPMLAGNLVQQLPRTKLSRTRSQPKLDQFKKDQSKWYNNYETFDNALPAITRGGLAGVAVGLPLALLSDHPEATEGLSAAIGALGGLSIAKSGKPLKERVQEKQDKLTAKKEFKKDVQAQLEKF